MRMSLAALGLAGLTLAGAGCSIRDSSRDISYMDINGDEQPDRVSLRSYHVSSDYYIVSQLNIGGGKLGEETNVAVLGKKPVDVYLRDGAGNGRPDLFYVLDTGADGAIGTTEYHLYIMKAKGDGTFMDPKFVKRAANLHGLLSG